MWFFLKTAHIDVVETLTHVGQERWVHGLTSSPKIIQRMPHDS
jgi:hypothetical protein